MSKKINRKEGFTIIEVLIVLAIAGVIMLIVFLAVPALQRNSRNTQRKSDVSALLAGVTEFTSNNQGALPTAWASNKLTGAAGTTPAGASLGYYTAVTFATGVQSALTTDTLQVVTGATCGASGATVAGGARQVAAQYMIEGASGLVAQCQGS